MFLPINIFTYMISNNFLKNNYFKYMIWKGFRYYYEHEDNLKLC